MCVWGEIGDCVCVCVEMGVCVVGEKGEQVQRVMEGQMGVVEGETCVCECVCGCRDWGMWRERQVYMCRDGCVWRER